MLRASVLVFMLFFPALGFAPPAAPSIATPATASPTPAPAVDEAAPKPLSGGQGYLVLDLRLEQRVSEISFGMGTLPRFTFGPYEKGRHLLLLPFPKGAMRLQRVAAPSYDLPFNQVYSGYDRLQFKVLPGRTNYFGQIIVGDIRSSYGFEIHARNRLAYTYGELTEKYGSLVAQYPIHYAGGLVDHFYNEFLKPEQATEGRQ